MKKICIDIDTIRDSYSKFNEIYYKFINPKILPEISSESLDKMTKEEVQDFFEERTKELELPDFNQSELNDKTLGEIFNIESKDLAQHLYNEYSLEIFGFSGKYEKYSVKYINELLLDIIDEELDIEISLVSKEFNNSIGATYFFIAKNNIKCSNVKFYTNKEKYFNDFDIIVTSDPIFNTLKKPDDSKIIVKIERDFNKSWTNGYDYSYDSIESFYYSEFITKLKNE